MRRTKKKGETRATMQSDVDNSKEGGDAEVARLAVSYFFFGQIFLLFILSGDEP